MKLFCVRFILPHQLDGDRERASYIFIVGKLFIVAVEFIMNGTCLEHLRLQRDADGDFLFSAQGRYPHFTVRTVDLSMRLGRPGGVYPTTFSALRQAAACGAGSGGS